MPKLFLYVIVFMLLSDTAFSQCDCNTELSYVIKKVESGYPGYLFAVNKDNKDAYEAFKSRLLTKASASTYDSCYFILREYVDYFHDGHLSITEYPFASQHYIDSVTANAPRSAVTKETALRYYQAHMKTLDPAEGIWQNDMYEMAVIKTGKDEFTGTVLSSGNKKWKQGEVKAILYKKSKNEYDVLLYDDQHLKKNTESEIWKRVLMDIGPYAWTKTFPEDVNLQYVNVAKPELPVIRKIDEDDIVLAMPSFLIDRSYLDSLVKSFSTQLRHTRNLIIDLRGNLGGNMVYESLLPYLYTDSMKQYGNQCIANEDNIQYFKTLIENAAKYGADSSWAKRKLAILENNKGKTVQIIEPDAVTYDSVYAYPKRIAVITDMSNRSAAEAFLKYYAKQSKKVIQFGTRTRGVLDYGSLNGIRLACKNDKYILFYPIFFENNLPQAGINKTGIIPDVKINETVKDQVEFVKEYLHRLK